MKTVELQDWKFKACGDTEWQIAHVPGCVHTDLLRCGIIPDPFHGTNEHNLQWIDKQDWEYRTDIVLSQGMLAESNLELVFEGLDTFADVYLNEQLVLTADNMFRSWRTDIKSQVRPGNNTIRIVFHSPIGEGLHRLEQLGYGLPASNDQSRLGGLDDKKVSVFARKAPYHFGWDWGPRFVTSGIWRPCRVEAWSGIRIRDLYIRQDLIREDSASLTAVLTIASDAAKEVEIVLSAEGQHQWGTSLSLAPGSQTVELPAEIARPRLWWCRGLGEAYLYTFQASVKEGEIEHDRFTARTGLRTVQLVREPDEAGTSFYFELNGVPVFAKGANHIPNDSFLPEITAERYRHEILSAAEANMNMLRVWGGGIYEADIFYDLCDEHGIMIWQDFMFGCSMYPGDEAFLTNIRHEAEENVIRLRNHPCVVLWCGNNEMDLAWAHYNDQAGWGWKNKYEPEIRTQIWMDYEAIFHHLLPQTVSRHLPDGIYWPSSPLAALTGDINQHANPRRTSGDIHYWGVWHNKEPFDQYNRFVGRFVSEYGFQSFPEPRTVKTYADDASMVLESPVMQAHQKHPSGNELIKSYMEMYTKEPRDFESFLYMSQILQAEAIKTAIEAHRRRKPYCMGSLYWQMNDCWPVASWSGMDYYGRWKAVHYTVKRAFRDISLAVAEENGGIAVYLITDLAASFEGTVRIRLFQFDGGLLFEKVLSVRTNGLSSEVIYNVAAKELLRGIDPAAVVLRADLEAGKTMIDSKDFLFVRDKDLQLPTPVITVTAAPGGEGAEYIIESDSFARQVWLEAEAEGIFSDNYFDLVPGIPKAVSFLGRPSSSGGFTPSAPGKVIVRSMADCVKLSTLES